MRTITLIFALLLSVSLLAENDKANHSSNLNNQVSGKIVDHITGENLAGVKIQVLNSDICAYTDLDGNFAIELPNENNDVQIKVSFISYETGVFNLEKISNKSSLRIIPVSR